MTSKKSSEEFLSTSQLSASEIDLMRTAMKAELLSPRLSAAIYYRDGIQVVPLVEGAQLVIGRAPPADVTLRDDSLSRQHACLEVEDGEVWVEDLGSTNGTWINGQQVSRAKVDPEDVLSLGTVTATLRSVGPAETALYGIDSHDRFMAELHAEVCRAKEHDGRTALVIIRAERRSVNHVSRWLPRVRELLRPYERIALYSPTLVEVLLPEGGTERARMFAQAVTSGSESLLCGVGVIPEHALSGESLLEVSLAACHRATAEVRVNEAGAVALRSPEAGDELGVEVPVASSEAMSKVFETARKLASSVIPVLLLGETGTGKEVVASAIHEGGKRRGKPMICVNCGAIPDQLLESTLFGHEKGAFTGAGQTHRGVFEAANGGTVFLDEIGELPQQAQAALLRVLENKRVTRVGSTKENEVDVRIIAATHQDLLGMCKDDRFREDLYYRLDAITVSIPPLRERPGDIKPLVVRFIAGANEANECQVRDIDEAALTLLMRYSWPGNVRELRNAIERAVVLSSQDMITVEDLPERVRALEQPLSDRNAGVRPPNEDSEEGSELVAAEGEINLKDELQRHESELILSALSRSGWDREAAARSLGLSLRTLARKMSSYNIKRIYGSQS